MGDAEAAEALILPHSVLLAGSRVGDGEVWGGVPSRPIPPEEMEKLKESLHNLRRRDAGT